MGIRRAAFVTLIVLCPMMFPPAAQGAEARGIAPEEFTRFMRAEVERFTRVQGGKDQTGAVNPPVLLYGCSRN